MQLWFKYVASPIGVLQLVAQDDVLVAVFWKDLGPVRVQLAKPAFLPRHPILLETEAQLAAYFAGHLQAFSIPLQPAGTPFQHGVWTALIKIPYGQTQSYGALAQQIGRSKAQRAVGAATGKNPLSIIVPCHRVVGAQGKLTGFAGGLSAKTFLLGHETKYS